MSKAMPELITMEQALRQSKGNGRTLEDIKANYAETVKEVEAKYGPHVPSIYLHLLPKKRGRPKNGAAADPVKIKSVKMSPDFWDELQALAARQGITLHNAIRAALVEYVARKHA
jgi:hypothetical protein